MRKDYGVDDLSLAIAAAHLRDDEVLVLQTVEFVNTVAPVGSQSAIEQRLRMSTYVGSCAKYAIANRSPANPPPHWKVHHEHMYHYAYSLDLVYAVANPDIRQYGNACDWCKRRMDDHEKWALSPNMARS